MNQLRVRVRLRPVRIAFLVRPDDREKALAIFRINTCLWGGQFNAIIPFFERVPHWWDKHFSSGQSARQIRNGYLDYFEPEFLVEAETGLAQGLGFDPERIFLLSDILATSQNRSQSTCGLSVFDLYKDIYERKFQFVRRHKHGIANVVAEDARFTPFSACVFGGFPTDDHLEYLSRGFHDAFDPASIALNGDSLRDAYGSDVVSALRVGHQNIEADFHIHSTPTLFVLDALQPRDLIDFWNLRSIQPATLAIPVQWLEKLSEFCRNFVRSAYRPMPNNPHGVMLHATVMFSRSISTTDAKALHENYIATGINGADVVQEWYPSFWQVGPQPTRPTLKSKERSVDLQYAEESPEVRFESIHPEFAARFGTANRWANVVRIDDWGLRNQLATALPINFRDPKFSPFRTGGEKIITTTEGLVVFPAFRGIPHYWRLPDGAGAIGEWLMSRGIKVRPSPAGKAAQQIIKTLGGFNGVRNIASPGIVKVLNEIARKPLSKSEHHHAFVNKINNAVKGDLWRNNPAKALIERNVVELGLELNCAKCSSWSWYSLKQLDYTMTCSLCLREYGFPILEPTDSRNSRWAYRLIGPFALPDYASGGYAAALAIRFFSEMLRGMELAVTWAAGQELTFPTGEKIETDFVLWYQRQETFANCHSTNIVFGEAKSFGRENSRDTPTSTRRTEDVFLEHDVAKMKRLAIAFPGSALVFATMRDASDLTTKEVERLRRLAEWGRLGTKESRLPRAPVIILTGTELFSGHSLRTTWEDMGGKHKQLISWPWIDLDHLNTLADLTQQINLGMPAYFDWMRARSTASKLRRQKANQHGN